MEYDQTKVSGHSFSPAIMSNHPKNPTPGSACTFLFLSNLLFVSCNFQSLTSRRPTLPSISSNPQSMSSPVKSRSSSIEGHSLESSRSSFKKTLILDVGQDNTNNANISPDSGIASTASGSDSKGKDCILLFLAREGEEDWVLLTVY